MTTENEETKCTLQELTNIITAPSGGLTMLPNDAFNEVYPGIYIGEESIAKNYAGLKRLGITHVLNAAMGQDKFYHVNTNEKYYSRTNIQFYGVEAIDHDSFNMSPYFDECSSFIGEALKTSGKILVHCRQGVSRSTTLVLAYLMMYKHMTVQDATRLVRDMREICPNDGFLLQLINLNEKLHNQGHYDKKLSSEKT